MSLHTRLKFISAGLFILCFALAGVCGAGQAVSKAGGPYTISGVTLGKTREGLRMTIKGETTPTYTVYELFDPLRLVLDIADARLAGSAEFPPKLPQGPVREIKNVSPPGQELSPVVRLEIHLNDDPAYSVERKGNDIVVTFSSEPVLPAQFAPEAGGQAADELAALVLAKPKAKEKTGRKKKSGAKKAAPVLAEAPAAPLPKSKTREDDFGFSGYEQQRITVDFFKIDLHNVFRLFGEISGQNIVVDEAVSGTLTLALNDVPWDFALDIILNLKDLQKKERFNTIVISPKAKQFNWAKAANDAVSVKGGKKVEAISVKQRLETPKGVVAAQNIIEQARAAEGRGQLEQALLLYEDALKLWPENARLAMHIAALCLTQTGMNAKAVHYARLTLNLEPSNREAALQAAVALANMRKTEEAQAYFDMAVNGGSPTSESLISYAAFAEEGGNYQGALTLLARHEAAHGDTLDTMVSRARILDKLERQAEATAAYQAVLLSGYKVPEDLMRFIRGRIAAERP